MEEFKLGDKVVCNATSGGYYSGWREPETIVRETKSCWVTDRGSQIRKDTHSLRGFNEPYATRDFYLLTPELKAKLDEKSERQKLEGLLSKEIPSALAQHKLSLQQLRKLKTSWESL